MASSLSTFFLFAVSLPFHSDIMIGQDMRE